MEEFKIENVSYNDLINAGWSHDQIQADPKWSALIPKPTIPSPPSPPSPPSNTIPNEDSQPGFLDATFDQPDGAVPLEQQLQGITDIPIDPTSTTSQPNAMASPLESITESYSPQGEDIIANITPADFDNITKILNVIIRENPTDNLIIRQSKVKQGTADCIIEANMAKILHNRGNLIDLDIINPKRYVSLFSQFRSENNIFITDDPANSRFIITNGEVRLFLPKQQTTVAQQVQSLDTTNSQTICQRTIDKETRKVIKGFSKDQDFIEYLIQDNIIKAIHIPDTAIVKFAEFIKDEKAAKLDETNADLTLRTSSFLPIDADSYTINILKQQDQSYAAITTCQIGGLIDVVITELVDNTTGGNILI